MMNIEPHHRKIRTQANAIHFGMIPLAILVPVLWIYFAYGICQESESPFMTRICSLSQLVPMLPALAGILVLGFILWELVRIGIKHHELTHGTKVDRPRLAHAVHGYRAIDDRHRRHIHLAALQVAVVSLALLLWLLCEMRYSTH